ncbi:MAG: hypothetical protein KKB21_03785 [Nanoarchaeota archaeon]|nr:hypothetical protein [Nanoarchaeota archaeon]
MTTQPGWKSKLADYLEQRGHLDLALWLLKKEIKSNPNYYTHCRLGVLLHVKSQREKNMTPKTVSRVIYHLSNSSKHNPDYAPTYLYLGVAYKHYALLLLPPRTPDAQSKIFRAIEKSRHSLNTAVKKDKNLETLAEEQLSELRQFIQALPISSKTRSTAYKDN